jgi:hypothetical protein
MRGPFRRFQFTVLSVGDFPSYALFELSEAGKDKYDGPFSPDVNEPRRRSCLSLCGLIIGKRTRGAGPKSVFWQGLVLVLVEGHDEIYTRVGLFKRWSSESDDQDWITGCEERTVKII